MKKLSTKEILEENLSRTAPQGLKSLKLVVHNIRSLHNVGAIFRSADAFGIDEILLTGYSPAPPRPEINKTAIGAEEFMNWQQNNDGVAVLNNLKRDGYYIIGLEQTTNSTELPDFDPVNHHQIAIVLGSEVSGIDDQLLPLIDEFVSIPQFGHKHSLNVSVAAGVVLYAFLEKLWQ